MGQYSIRDLEKVTGIKAHTIRIWEKRYGIIEPDRTDTNIRSYTDEELKTLLNISLLNRNGIKISHLARMSPGEINRHLLALEKSPDDMDTLVDQMLMAMIELEEFRFRDLLGKAISDLGFEQTFTRVLRKLLNKAGTLWMTGTINPAQEHFVSNIIRQQLIVQIDRVTAIRRKDARKFLLFLPEGEMHEIALLYFNYLIRSRGHESLYFGQTTPLDSVIEAVKSWKPAYLLLAIVSPVKNGTINEYLDNLRLSFPGVEVMVHGYQIREQDPTAFPAIRFIRHFEEFEGFLDAIDAPEKSH